MKRLLVVLSVVLVVAGGACSDATRDEAAEDVRESAEDAYEEGKEAVGEAADRAEDVVNDRTIEIDDFAFKPATRTVKVGTEVTWINRDDVDHTATAKNESFDGEVSGRNAEFSFRFTQAGEFEYFCEIHGEDRMSGTIVVE